MRYNGEAVQQILNKILTDVGVGVESLKTKDELAKIGIAPRVFTMFAENRYKNGVYLESYYNIYVVAKTLGGSSSNSIMTVLDKIRDAIARSCKDNRKSLKIIAEEYIETGGYEFMFLFKIDMGSFEIF